MGITATEILSRAALARRIGASTAAEPAAAAVEINCLLVNAMMCRLRCALLGFRQITGRWAKRSQVPANVAYCDEASRLTLAQRLYSRLGGELVELRQQRR